MQRRRIEAVGRHAHLGCRTRRGVRRQGDGAAGEGSLQREGTAPEGLEAVNLRRETIAARRDDEAELALAAGALGIGLTVSLRLPRRNLSARAVQIALPQRYLRAAKWIARSGIDHLRRLHRQSEAAVR